MTNRPCECGPSISAIAALQSVETVSGHPLFVIDHRVPLSQRKAFSKLALGAQGSMPEYPAGYDGTVDGAEQTMLVLSKDGHATGMVIVAIDSPCWSLSWTGDGSLTVSDRAAAPIERPRTVARVWIAAAYRRRGLAAGLLKATARHFRVECAELGWELPLAESGASTGGGKILVELREAAPKVLVIDEMGYICPWTIWAPSRVAAPSPPE